MNINSMVFVTAFLPVVLVADRLCLRNIKAKNALLLIASLFFYAWGNPAYAVLLVVSAAVNYGIGVAIDSCQKKQVSAGLPLALGVVLNLGLLGYYKYFNIVLDFINDLAGHQLFVPHGHSLPIGISIFTFSAISYLVDVYRKKHGAERNFWHLALYISFFAKVSVGPIARYEDFGPQLKCRSVTSEMTVEGIRRFSYGLAKKMLIATHLQKKNDASTNAFIQRAKDMDIQLVTDAALLTKEEWRAVFASAF